LATDSKYYEYAGVIHVHSRYSDGSGTVKKIINEAKKADLDYVVINDHNTTRAKDKGREGWHDGLLVLVGEEIGPKRSNHYLALGIDKFIHPKVYNCNYIKYIEEVKRQGGIGFIAHPYGFENKQFHIKIVPWKDWDNPDYTGIEIWSYMHDWSDDVNLLNIVYYYFKPDKAINGPPISILHEWDRLCQKRRIVGIGSSDVHAKYLFPFFMVKFLSYRKAFQGVRTHLLLPYPLESKLDEDKIAIYKAFGAGHCFFAYDYLANSKGFSFGAFTDDSDNLVMGDEIKLKSKVNLVIKSPVPSTIRLIKNGQLIKETDNSLQLNWVTDECGVYRAEAQYQGRPWVFSNPIYLR
jgi:hypothetical protein